MRNKSLNRRKFLAFLSTGSFALAAQSISNIVMGRPQSQSKTQTQTQVKQKPATNINDASKVPRNTSSMPGKFPGKVIQITNSNSVINNEPLEKEAYLMLKKAMLKLTGQRYLNDAWRMFDLGLGVSDISKINFTKIDLG